MLLCVRLHGDTDFKDLVQEGVELVDSANYNLVYTLKINRRVIDPKYFIGSGKVEELKILCNQLNINALVVNHNLTPIQERNLAKELDIDVIDRTGLILDIFASRVKSNEGVLQVELAKQSFLLTRLVGRWTHLERQRGGTGTIGGAGEKQIELDKRMIKEKIKSLKARLELVVKQRRTQRKSREKHNVCSISIVGYTNAGKSTLFNCLTNGNVYAQDRLFATLQTTSRKCYLSDSIEAVLSDTVGFIRDLPHGLVAAFKATLEETIHAGLLLNVVDVSGVLKERQIKDVDSVLNEIEAGEIPQLIIYNKIDLEIGIEPRIEYDINGVPYAVYISAEKKLGLELLKNAILEKLFQLTKNKSINKFIAYEPWSIK